MVSDLVYSCLVTLVFCGVTVSWVPGSDVMVRPWQMIRRSRSPTVVVGTLELQNHSRQIHS